MGDHPLRRLKPGTATRGAAALLAIATLLAIPSATAQGPGRLAVVLTPPEHLVEEDRAEVVAEVRMQPPSDAPLLVTPSTEGTAVEVVRGRLLRSDAEDPDAERLRFRIPIVARSAGTSVLRVRVRGWVCSRRCAPVSGEASLVLRVARRAE